MWVKAMFSLLLIYDSNRPERPYIKMQIHRLDWPISENLLSSDKTLFKLSQASLRLYSRKSAMAMLKGIACRFSASCLHACFSARVFYVARKSCVCTFSCIRVHAFQEVLTKSFQILLHAKHVREALGHMTPTDEPDCPLRQDHPAGCPKPSCSAG